MASSINAICEIAVPLERLVKNEYSEIIKAVGHARVVLIGESTHGTQEFYWHRAELTKALINQGFGLVCCEGDFPPFFQINRHVSSAVVPGPSSTHDAMSCLKGRFPQWMWHNQVTKDFLEWLKAHNRAEYKTSIIGMDIYSLYKSITLVIQYLDKVDPDTALLARKFYGTLSSFGEDGFDYTRSLLNGSISQQKDNVAKMLAELNKNELDYVKAASNGDEFFSAFENSFIVSTAESYYRNFLPGGEDTWSIRDTAMADIVGHALKWHTRKYGKVCRAVIWAHNSHICNDSNSRVTLGHLMRQRFACYTIGFSTNTGTVRAAREWGGPDLVLDLKPSISDSAGDLFHRVGLMRTLDFGVFFANLTDKQRSVLGRSMWQRFVGVQYLRETELASHYSKCSMTNQYDMMIHIDKTTAVKRVSDGIDYSKWEHIDEYDSAEDY